MSPPLTDLGEARVTTPEDRALRAECSLTAQKCVDLTALLLVLGDKYGATLGGRALQQQCKDVAARLVVLASHLDPDMPGVPMPGVAPVPQQRRG